MTDTLERTCDELEYALLIRTKPDEWWRWMPIAYLGVLVRHGELQIARAQIEFVSGVRLEGEYHPEDIEASLLDRFFNLRRRAEQALQ